jgi:hypothetical protein
MFKKLILSFRNAETAISFAAFKTQGLFPPFCSASKASARLRKFFKSGVSVIGKVEFLELRFNSFGVSKSVLDWQFHIGLAYLSFYCSIFKFDQ